MNHRTNADVICSFITLPRYKLHFIGKESLFKPRTLLNWFLRSLNGVPLRPTNNLAIIRHSLNVLKSGESMVIFPEGRRNFNQEDALSVRAGTAVIAMKAGVPVIPIVTNRPARPFRFNKFNIGNTIYPSDFHDKNEFTIALRDEMARLLVGFEHIPRQKKWDREPVKNVRGVVFIDGKLLVLKRTRPEKEIYYSLPGGSPEENETTRETAVREIKEETNVETEAIRCLYKNRCKVGMRATYLCQYKNGEVSTTNAKEYQPNNPKGKYEPMLIDVADLKNLNLKPHSVRNQLIRDIKRYGIHLTRPTKYLK